jgi:hypothetical protein
LAVERAGIEAKDKGKGLGRSGLAGSGAKFPVEKAGIFWEKRALSGF